MRDTGLPPSPEFCFGQFTLLPAQRTLLCDGEPVRLGSRALDLLILLAERAGEVVSKEELMAHVWPKTIVEEGGLRVHMAALRKALGEGSSGVRYITNVPLRGYCLVAPTKQRSTQGPPGRVAMAALPASLPSSLTRLVGRETCIATLVDSLALRRLVTVVGPGGMGKTSVALAGAERLREHYADGAAFVDFASLADPQLIPGAVAAVLGIPLHSDDATRDIASALAGRSVLVVLDNCEHVVSVAASFVEALLGAAPQVHIVATSREPLRARGEWVQRLGSLPVPPEAGAPSYAQALAYPAFELFVERAMASHDGVNFQDADVALIAQLCRRLDGMPLAIELVAAQVAFFGLAGLVEKLDDRLSLPTLGHRTALPRHQTLRATLQWSYELLSPREQRVLRCLSVFRERFSLAAALEVAAAQGIDVAHVLMGLVSKSLVSAEPADAGVQYRLLETTRSYASERLAQSEDRHSVSRLHCRYCMEVVQQASVEIETLVPARWRERHGRKIDDVRAALDWAFGAGDDPLAGARLLAESPALWFGLWLVKEYTARLTQARAVLPGDAAGSRLDMQLSVEYGQASLAMRGGALESLQALARGADIAHELDDTSYSLRALWARFGGLLLRGDYVGALQDTERYGHVARHKNEAQAEYIYHRMKALCLHFLGNQVPALEHARLALHPAAAGIRNTNGNAYQFEHRSASLSQLARILWLRGFPEQAMQAARDAVETAKAADHALSLTYALSYAACPIALWCGADHAAQEYVDELQACTDSHSLVFWQSWPRLFQQVVAMRRQGSATQFFDERAIQISQVDTLATLHPAYLTQTAVQRAQDQLNAWCIPEIWRALGERALASHPHDTREGERLLRDALALSREQGAAAWTLRAATSLAALLQGRGEHGEASDLLGHALAHFQEGHDAVDVVRARQIAQHAQGAEIRQ